MPKILIWKKIYQTVSGASSPNISENIVSQVLTSCKEQLINGFLTYKPFTAESYSEWKANLDVNDNIKEFVLELSQDLNLDANVTHPLMCSYLMFEYTGKIKEFWQLTSSTENLRIPIPDKHILKEDIWNFYTNERMFLLKTWRHILELVNDVNYPFAAEYERFLKNITVESLTNCLIAQFENITNEMLQKPTSTFFQGEIPYLEQFLCRCLREQAEIVSVLTLINKWRPVTSIQFRRIVTLFCQNFFSIVPPVYEFRHKTDQKYVQELMFAEIGCFLAILQNYWEQGDPNFWASPDVKELEGHLQELEAVISENVLILIAWRIVKLRALQDGKAGEEAMELLAHNPFIALESLVSSHMFKNCVLGETVIQACHRVLDEIVLMFDGRKELFKKKGVVGTVAEFLTRPSLASICMRRRNGLDAIMDIAASAFPLDFFSFTSFARALLGDKDQCAGTLKLLRAIPFFLSEQPWTDFERDFRVLYEAQSPVNDARLIMFPPPCGVFAYDYFGEPKVQYRGPYSYFAYLEHLLAVMVSDWRAQSQVDDALVQKVTAGFGVVVEAIKNCEHAASGHDVRSLLKKLHEVMNCIQGSLLNLGIIKVFFDVHSALSEHKGANFFDVCPAELWKFVFPKLEVYHLEDIEQWIVHPSIFKETIFVEVFKKKHDSNDHSFVLSYIKLLHNILKVNYQFKQYQLSGVTFLLNIVFMQHRSWSYKDENQQFEITICCLKIFHLILQKSSDDSDSEAKKIFTLCQMAFINNPHVIDKFLGLFITDKYYLSRSMDRESNWIAGANLKRLSCIRWQFSLLLLILQQKKAFEKCALDLRLHFHVQTITSYINNPYNPVIAELTCRFLEKLAQDVRVHLLALFKLDSHQIQALFLDKLRDPVEDERVKVAILDFINSCLSSQDGMVMVFFNLRPFKPWNEQSIEYGQGFSPGQNFSDFMTECLQKTNVSFKNPMQRALIRILHTLFASRKENLIKIKPIINFEELWFGLMNPFFTKNQDLEVYIVILKILNAAMNVKLNEINSHLVKVVQRFFRDAETVQYWINYMLSGCKTSSTDHVELLNLWMGFVVLGKRIIAESISPEVKFALIDSCLDGINLTESGARNVETISIWSQLYLMLTKTWPLQNDQVETVFTKLMSFFHSLSSYYSRLRTVIKIMVLHLLNRTIADFQNYFRDHIVEYKKLLYHVGDVVDAEFKCFMLHDFKGKSDQEQCELMKPWLTVMFTGSAIISCHVDEDVALWFSHRKFLRSAMDSVGRMIEQPSTIWLGKLAIGFMLNYAESPLLAKHFFDVDLPGFYGLDSQPTTIDLAEAISDGFPMHLREWWLFLTALIRLTRNLMRMFDTSIFDICFTFVTKQNTLFRDMISLTKFTFDMTALNLVCECFVLVIEFLQRKPTWIIDHPSSYWCVMEGARITMNACVLSITRYSKIFFFKINKGILSMANDVPNELLTAVLNKLHEVLYWTCRCLKATQPDLLIIENRLKLYNLAVDIDFTRPRFENPISDYVTFGDLLELAKYLCACLEEMSPNTPAAVSKINSVTDTNLNDYDQPKWGEDILERPFTAADPYISFLIYVSFEDFDKRKADRERNTFEFERDRSPRKLDREQTLDFYKIISLLNPGPWESWPCTSDSADQHTSHHFDPSKMDLSTPQTLDLAGRCSCAHCTTGPCSHSTGGPCSSCTTGPCANCIEDPCANCRTSVCAMSLAGLCSKCVLSLYTDCTTGPCTNCASGVCAKCKSGPCNRTTSCPCCDRTWCSCCDRAACSCCDRTSCSSCDRTTAASCSDCALYSRDRSTTNALVANNQNASLQTYAFRRMVCYLTVLQSYGYTWYVFDRCGASDSDYPMSDRSDDYSLYLLDRYKTVDQYTQTSPHGDTDADVIYADIIAGLYPRVALPDATRPVFSLRPNRCLCHCQCQCHSKCSCACHSKIQSNCHCKCQCNTRFQCQCKCHSRCQCECHSKCPCECHYKCHCKCHCKCRCKDDGKFQVPVCDCSNQGNQHKASRPIQYRPVPDWLSYYYKSHRVHYNRLHGLDNRWDGPTQSRRGDMDYSTLASLDRNTPEPMSFNAMKDSDSKALDPFERYLSECYSNSSAGRRHFPRARTAPVVPRMDYETVKNSLESLMTFIAWEIFSTMKHFDNKARSTFSRVVNFEMQFFYEFLKGRTEGQYPTSFGQAQKDFLQAFRVGSRFGAPKTDTSNHFLVVISKFLMDICEPKMFREMAQSVLGVHEPPVPDPPKKMSEDDVPPNAPRGGSHSLQQPPQQRNVNPRGWVPAPDPLPFPHPLPPFDSESFHNLTDFSEQRSFSDRQGPSSH